MPNRLIVAAKTEDAVAPAWASGIFKPPAWMTTNLVNERDRETGESLQSIVGPAPRLRIFGVIVGVGASRRLVGDRWEICPPSHGLEWGDVVEISHFSGGQSLWWVRPLWDVFDRRGEAVEMGPADGGLETYAIREGHLLGVIPVSAVICRLARRRWVFGRQGEPPAIEPVADRVLVRHEPRVDRTASGIVMPDWWWQDTNPLAEVVAVGPQVTGLMPGDWCVPENQRGTILHGSGGEVRRLVRERDVLMRCEQKPDGAIELPRQGDRFGT
jgi:co-chaperonin GroES (HSP10)